jgi:hypothetical protein
MADFGRPNEYKKEYIDEADNYLADCQDEYTEFHKTRGQKSDSYERIIKVKLPSIEGFALRLNVSVKSLYNWSAKDKNFLQALEKIKTEQKQRCIEFGLSGDYNPTIAKLILSANHGMVERNDTTSGGKPIPMLYAISNNNSNPENTGDEEKD